MHRSRSSNSLSLSLTKTGPRNVCFIKTGHKKKRPRRDNIKTRWAKKREFNCLSQKEMEKPRKSRGRWDGTKRTRWDCRSCQFGRPFALGCQRITLDFYLIVKMKTKTHNSSSNNNNKNTNYLGGKRASEMEMEGFAGKWGVMIYNVAKIECNPNRSYLHLLS